MKIRTSNHLATNLFRFEWNLLHDPASFHGESTASISKTSSKKMAKLKRAPCYVNTEKHSPRAFLLGQICPIPKVWTKKNPENGNFQKRNLLFPRSLIFFGETILKLQGVYQEKRSHIPYQSSPTWVVPTYSLQHPSALAVRWTCRLTWKLWNYCVGSGKLCTETKGGGEDPKTTHKTIIKYVCCVFLYVRYR